IVREPRAVVGCLLGEDAIAREFTRECVHDDRIGFLVRARDRRALFFALDLQIRATVVAQSYIARQKRQTPGNIELASQVSRAHEPKCSVLAQGKLTMRSLVTGGSSFSLGAGDRLETQ